MIQQERRNIQKLKKSKEPFQAFLLLPPEERTEKVSACAVRCNPVCLGIVPPESLTKEFFQAVNLTPDIFTYIPTEWQTENMFLAAIEADPRLYLQIPEERINPKLIEKLLEHPFLGRILGNNVLNIFPHIKEPDLLTKAVKTIGWGIPHRYEEILKRIDKRLLTDELVDFMIKDAPVTMEVIPNKFKTYDRCLKFALLHGHMLEMIPDKWKTRKFFLAIRDSPFAINYMPEKIQEFIDLVDDVKEYPFLYSELEKSERTKELQMEVAQTGDLCLAPGMTHPASALILIQNMELKYQSEEYLQEPILPKFKKRVIREDFAREFVRKVPQEYDLLIQRFPAFRENRPMAAQAVMFYSPNLFHIKEEFKTEALCKGAARENFSVTEAFPKRMFTPEFCKEVINKDTIGFAPGWIPEEQRTPELCRLMIEKALNQYRYKYPAFRCIPFPDMVTDVICKATPYDAVTIYRQVPPEHRTKEMTAETQKKAECLIQESPIALYILSNELKTPEVCLWAIQHNPHLNREFIPVSVRRGDNLFTFSQQMPFKDMPLEQIRREYQEHTQSQSNLKKQTRKTKKNTRGL